MAGFITRLGQTIRLIGFLLVLPGGFLMEFGHKIEKIGADMREAKRA